MTQYSDRPVDPGHRDPKSGAPAAQADPPEVGVIVGGPEASGARSDDPPPPDEPVTEPDVGVIVGGAPAGERRSPAFDPAPELEHWRQHFRECTYVEPHASFNDYGPAYGLGASSFARYPGRSFEDVETEMAGHWPASRGTSSLSWGHARPAARDAWHRLLGGSS